MNIKMLIATHKKYEFPDDNIYVPFHVGKKNKQDLGYLGDDTGDNISEKNSTYCELTALYWAWKNLDCDYIGICHYRRYFLNEFSKTKKERKMKNLLKKDEIEKIMKDYDVILPKKTSLNGINVFNQYGRGHFATDMLVVKEIINEIYPEDNNNFNFVMNDSSIYYYNMCIMKKEEFNRYSEWLFKILFEVEKRVDIENYDNYQKRIFGFISERLLNIWIYKQNYRVKEMPLYFKKKVSIKYKCIDFLKGIRLKRG